MHKVAKHLSCGDRSVKIEQGQIHEIPYHAMEEQVTSTGLNAMSYG
jgi:hypothetical protein